MKYMGSKNRIAKHILPIMLQAARERGITKWVEPFVGGGNMIDKVPAEFDRVGYDINEHVIMAMIDIRDNVHLLPDSFSFEQRNYFKKQPAASITSWACIVTSFGADLSGGYAREKGSDDSTFVGYGKRNAIKQSPKIQGVDFVNQDYLTLSFSDSLVYCDPPYKGTTGYNKQAFDSEVFFHWCREQAKNNIVFISEYDAPFDEVWRGEIKTNFSSTRSKATHNAVEKLYRC